MELNKEDLEKTQEIPVITDDMEITQPLEVVNEEPVQTNQKQEKSFETFKRFVKVDMRSKEELIDLAPEELDDYDEVSRIEYSDRLDHGLRDFSDEFGEIANGFELGDVVKDALKKFFDVARGKLAVGKYETGIGNKMYQEAFTNMRPEFVDEVKDKCVGYTGADPERLAELIGKSQSVNEVLHAMHSYIMNNEAIMKKMPMLGEKKSMIGAPIKLYGEMSPVAQSIFENFPNDLDVGITDIISMKDKVYMMVRDRGHALTIDMDTSKENDVDVRYFVPKLCNEEMIKALKGIDKQSITPNGARGAFSVKKENITEELFGFIEKVPTDGDIPERDWEGEFVEMPRENDIEQQNFENTVVPQQPEQEINVEEPKKETKEEIIGTETPIFSMDDAKEIATEPGRRMGRIEKFQKQLAEIFNPIMNKFKGKENPEIEVDSNKDVVKKDGEER